MRSEYLQAEKILNFLTIDRAQKCLLTKILVWHYVVWVPKHKFPFTNIVFLFKINRKSLEKNRFLSTIERVKSPTRGNT